MLLAVLLLATTNTTTSQPCQRARSQPAANRCGLPAAPRVELSSLQCHAELLPNVYWRLLVATGGVLHGCCRNVWRCGRLPPVLATAAPARPAAATAAAPAAQTINTPLLPLP